jgi:acetylornithine deacetylase/succinyl-diaminopimelate desuccinylase-like protein
MNWNSITDETTTILQDLIRFDTTNPPGNETPCVEYIARLLKRNGIESQVFESAPGRGNLVARLKGDGSLPPFLLMGHVDVVPAEADKWQRPPFSGALEDGIIWGRGATDMKQMVVMELLTFLLVKRANMPLKRDVIFMANADEEVGGRMGAWWMAKNHPDLIRAEYAINEGGGFGFDVLGHRFYTCQTGEKGTARFTMRTRGRPGHGSQPHRDNAVLKLAEAVQKIGAADLPLHVTAIAKIFIEGIAEKLGKPYDAALRAILDPKQHRAAMDHLPLDDGMRSMFYAMLHNTVAPTILKAGSKINVIPSMAEGQCDARLIPGQSPQDFLRELRAYIGNEVEVEFLDGRLGRESDHKTPLFDTMTRVMRKHEPAATLLPYLVVGATDARHVSKMGTRVYGFCPMFAPLSELGGLHGHDERIALDNLAFGTRVLHDVVRDFCLVG